MLNLLPTLEKVFPFVGLRSARESDFFQFCFRKGIEVVFTDSCTDGIYVLYDNEHFIFLNKSLSGWWLRYVMFHEIAHFLFHSPTQSSFGAEFFNLHAHKKNHEEAEAVAAILLLPSSEIGSTVQDPEIAITPELQELIRYRLTLFQKYRI